MSIKLGLRVGNVELNFEGAVDVFESKVEPAFKELFKLGVDQVDVLPVIPATKEIHVISGSVEASVPQMTVRSIASKLGADSATELITAAMASLMLVKGEKSCSRQQISEEMKLATGFFKGSYRGGNLTRALAMLVKSDVVIEVSNETFVLKDNARLDLENKLAL